MKVIAHVPDVVSGDLLIERMIDDYTELHPNFGFARFRIMQENTNEDKEEEDESPCH